jgi:hypothetical protein
MGRLLRINILRIVITSLRPTQVDVVLFLYNNVSWHGSVSFDFKIVSSE